MKKIYFFAAMAAATLTSSAAGQNVTVSHNVTGITAATVSESTSAIRISAVDAMNKDAAQLVKAPKAFKADDNAATKAPDDFVSLGTGVWVEGPMDYFSDVKSGVTHELEIFQSQSNPDIFCMTPYGTGSALADLMGKANTTKFYVNVSNPTKVLGYGEGGDEGDFMPFNGFQVSQMIPEYGWGDSATGYGVYSVEDKAISFPAGSYGIYVNGSWYQSNKDGKFKVYLPGAEVKDYSFSSEADLCNDDNKIRFMAEAGKDVAALKCLIMANTYPASANNLGIVAKQGNNMQANTLYTFTDEEAGVYTIFIVALDADGNVVDGAAHWVHILADDAANWESLGTGVWTDPILVDASYLESAAKLNVDVQRNIKNPALMRISSPYASFTDYTVTHEGHEHYIYLDVTNPDEVKVSLSLTGFDAGYGHITIESMNSYYSSSTAAELKQAGFGVPSYDEETNTITFPAKSIRYSEPLYQKGAWYVAQPAGSLVLPGEKQVEEETVPETLYALLTSDFDSLGYFELVKNDSVFTIERQFITESYLFFVNSIENIESAKFYGPEEDFSEIAESGATSDFLSFSIQNFTVWTVTPGYYNVEVDFATKTLTLTATTSAVEGLDVDNEAASAEYYNLQGIRVANPSNGVYIVRQGSQVTKQYIAK